MDWTKQAEETIKTWTNSQQKLWDSWIETLQGFSSAQSGETWDKSVDSWKDSVDRVLEAQTTWTQFLVDSVTSGPGATKQTTEWSKQIMDVSKRWTDTQAKLWESFFETVKKADMTTMSKNMNMEEVQKMVQTWQEAAQKAMETQMEWIRTWTTTLQNQQGDKK